MIRIQNICKDYLISNGWVNFDNFFIHKKIPDIVIYVSSIDIKYHRKNGIISMNHKGGKSITFLSRLHHSYGRLTFGNGKLPKGDTNGL